MVAGLMLAAGVAAAQEPGVRYGLNSAGMTGYFDVPAALTLPEGALALNFSNYQETPSRERHDFRGLNRDEVSLGLFDFLEIGGQFSTANDPSGQHQVLRDLAVGGKLRVPGIPLNWPQLAVGLDDAAGVAPFFRGRYVVSTYTLDALSASLGYGQRGQERLNGLFGAVQAQGPWGLHLTVEENHAVLTSLGWNSPLLLRRFRINAALARDIAHEPKTSVNLGLSLQLPTHDAPAPSRVDLAAITARAVALPAGDVAPPPPAAVVAAPPPVAATPVPPVAVDAVAMTAAELRLAQAGFAGAQLSQGPDGTYEADVENTVYRVNDIDALGVALGVLAETMGCSAARLGVILRREGLALLRVRVPARAYREFLGLGSCPADSAVAPPMAMDVEVYPRAVPPLRSSGLLQRRPLDLSFYPRLTYFIGTDVGAFDASTTVMADLRTPLWKGASLDTVAASPSIDSKNFKQGEPFGQYRNGSGLDALLFNQAWTFGGQTAALFSAGRFERRYEGAQLQAKWVIDQGYDQLALSAADLHDHQTGSWRRPVQGTYSLANPDWAAGLNLSYGTYLEGDHGVRAEAYRDFGDVRVSLFGIKGEHKFVGAIIRFPFSPRRSYRYGPLSVRGTDSWAVSIRTTAGKSGKDILHPDEAASLRNDYQLAKVLANNDRLSVDYIVAHMERLKESYWSLADENR